MIKVTEALSAKNISTSGEPCHTELVRARKIMREPLYSADQGENVTTAEIITPTSQPGQREVSSSAEYKLNTYPLKRRVGNERKRSKQEKAISKLMINCCF